jgi:hypothetical protein
VPRRGNAIVSATSVSDVLDWWTGELPDAESDRVEEALFADDAAFEGARWVADLARAIAYATHAGAVPVACLTHTLSSRLEQSGLPHTAYVARPGETVQCAATHDQRFSVVHLKADFTDAERVDVHVHSPHIGEMLVSDVPIDWNGGEVAVLQAGDAVRSIPTTTLTFELRGTRAGKDVVFGTYTLEHRALSG